MESNGHPHMDWRRHRACLGMGGEQASGLSTWWLGPPANGRHLVVNLVPFVAPFLALILAIGGSHRTWKIGILAGAVITLIGAVDLGRVTRLGIVEIVLGLAGAGSSLASWIGTPRATSP